MIIRTQILVINWTSNIEPLFLSLLHTSHTGMGCDSIVTADLVLTASCIYPSYHAGPWDESDESVIYYSLNTNLPIIRLMFMHRKHVSYIPRFVFNSRMVSDLHFSDACHRASLFSLCLEVDMICPEINHRNDDNFLLMPLIVSRGDEILDGDTMLFLL